MSEDPSKEFHPLQKASSGRTELALRADERTELDVVEYKMSNITLRRTLREQRTKKLESSWAQVVFAAGGLIVVTWFVVWMNWSPYLVFSAFVAVALCAILFFVVIVVNRGFFLLANGADLVEQERLIKEKRDILRNAQVRGALELTAPERMRGALTQEESSGILSVVEEEPENDP